VKLIGHDKKRAGANLRFIVAKEVGKVDLVDLPLDELRGHVLALA
jgi:3-dehydroquinate synthetase